MDHFPRGTDGIMISIYDVVDHAVELKPLPQTAVLLSHALSNEKTTVNDVAAIVKYDQILSGQILRLANSISSASRRKIGNINDAIIRVGTGRILEIVIAKSLKKNMQQPLAPYGYESMDLWRHSIAAAIATENMSHYVDVHVDGVAYAASLMHDIGKLALAPFIDEVKIQEMYSLMKTPMCWADAENKVFGFSHPEIGSELVNRWKLPEVIANGIKYHHDIEHNSDVTTDCVRVSNCVARVIGQGLGYEGMSLKMDSSVAERLKLKRENFEILCSETLTKFNAVMELFNSI